MRVGGTYGAVFAYFADAPPGKPAAFVRPFEPDSDYGVFVGPPVQPLAPQPERLLPGRQ